MKISIVAGIVCTSLVAAAGCVGETDVGIQASATTKRQSASESQGATKSDSAWQRIAPGVYQKTEADGSTTRMAYGDDGAKYDRAALNASIQSLESKVAGGYASDDDATELANARVSLKGIPLRATGPVTPELSANGTMCSEYYYFFDSQLIAGNVGITEVARAYVWSDLWGPAPPDPTSTIEYASATLGIHGAPTTKQTASTTIYATPIAAVNNTTDSAGGAANCTGSTFSYIQLNGGMCNASTYVSQSRSYNSCANAP